MAVYDDKIPGTIKSGNYFMISSIKSRTEAIFRASYIIGSGIQVEGKITALFDLIVIGDVVAHDIDVKGKFICLGNCHVNNSVTVQDKLFVKEISASSIEVHDDITAQEIDVQTLKADGNVIVGQTLAAEELAYSEQKILCGETAYGAGRLSAYTIITGEDLDMDDGEDAVVEPNKIVFNDSHETKKAINGNKYIEKNDFEPYLMELIDNCGEDHIKQYAFKRWNEILKQVCDIKKQDDFECYDVGLFLGLTEICFSEYFCGWETITQWQKDFLDLFNKIANGESTSRDAKLTINTLSVGQRLVHSSYGIGSITNIKKTDKTLAEVFFDSGKKQSFQMEIALKYFSRANSPTAEEIINRLYISPQGLGEWANCLRILQIYGHMFSPKLNDRVMDLLCSKIGVKPKFVLDRIKENGWSDDG